MKLRLLGMMCLAWLAGAFLAVPAEAKCTNFQKQYNVCAKTSKKTSVNTKKKTQKYAALKKSKKLAKVKKNRAYAAAKPKNRKLHASAKKKSRVYAGNMKRKNRQIVRSSKGGDRRVVALIKRLAPHYGVPTWFALRIAKIESGFRPHVRGAAGEYGVYQLKCSTARGIGFRGNCGALLNAETNVRYGLKHLSLAVRASRGNLRLAASKHNGGLGMKRLVPRYVAMVF
jgi:soluble lytic murein transglycosylase-like protein